MTRIFLDRGFTGSCHDLGEGSRRMMRKNLAYADRRISVADDLSELQECSSDWLFASEALEHIAADLDVLRGWARYLKPGGSIVASVSGHMRKYVQI